MGQMQHHRQANKDSHLIFCGTTEASCSSSDGSCNKDMISQQGREIDHSEQMYVPSYFCNRVEENQKIMISSQGDYVNDHQKVTSTSSNYQKQIGNGMMLWGGGVAPLEYGLEEIKQLISGTSTITSSCSNFMFDENKTEESSVMYY
jgi:myb proto-oncogene protein